MNKKMLTMILGALLVAAFFLPFYSSSPFSMSGISGFDVIQGPGKADKYVLLLSPVAGLLLLIGAANNGNYIPSRGILIFLALAGLLYLVLRPVIDGFDIGKLIQMLGIGYWLSLLAVLGLVLVNPKK